jgi:hypothetical protein
MTAARTALTKPRSRLLPRKAWHWLALVLLLPALAFGAYRALHKTRHEWAPEEVFLPRPLRPASRCEQTTLSGLAPHPVCITPWTKTRFLLCNYKIIQEVDLHAGTTTTLTPAEPPTVWQPTGVCACLAEGLVFVANYNGHDVLEMRRVQDRLVLVRRYTDSEMRSPENVALSADGQLVGVADYDGDRLLVFRRDGSLAWSCEVGQAHGVAFGPGFVVVTSLRDRAICKLDLSGNLLCRRGTPGWGDSKYLWPTCVAVLEGRVVVSDAHTGKISILDDGLGTLDWLGGNGPGAGLFNMPYGITGSASRLIVCDTFKDRIVLLDEDHRCARIVARRAEPLRWDVGLATRAVTRRGYVEVDASCEVAGPPPLGGAWHADYGGYTMGSERRPPSLRYPLFESLFNAQIFPYFCWCQTTLAAGRPYLLLGHSQDTHLLIVDAAGRCRDVDVHECLWRTDDGLRTNAGMLFDPAPFVDSTARLFAEHDRLLCEGADPVDALQRVYWPALSRAALLAQLERAFMTEAGKTFWKRWRGAGTAEDRQAAARNFDTAHSRERSICLQEVFLRNMLCARLK